jgi:hypothetical protein
MSRGLELFEKEVAPILKEHCLDCHGGAKTKGEFDIANRDLLLKGGGDGPSVVPFHADQSRLLKMLRHEEDPAMPERKPKLAEELIGKIAAWIDSGAPYSRPLLEGKTAGRDRGKVTEEDRAWWSFLPLSTAPVPEFAGKPHPVDRFLAVKGAAKGLSIAPSASRGTLIRRATLDLTGLPPTPEEVARFEKDPSPEAWPKLIDELLSRPAYGERWARHWMDVARYGESSGFEHDYDRVGSHHYRDFLIQAFNADLPFSQFVQWQIAGDEFAPGEPRALAATAFLSLGVFPTTVTINELERVRYEDMDDMLSTTGAAFLGLSVGCARCHDHKYDPIPTKDYYRMLATFTGTVRSEIDLDVSPEKTRELKTAWKAAHEGILEENRRLEESLKAPFQNFLARELATAPEPAGWTAWRPKNATASSGSKLVAQPDGSFVAQGAPADAENYAFLSEAPARPLTGLRVEALVEGAPKKPRSGRAPNGGFLLSKVLVELETDDGARRELEITKAEADFEENTPNGGVASALLGKKGSGWSVRGKEKEAHSAAFTFAEAVTPPRGSRIRVTLEFQGAAKHAMVRPRLSWMGGGAPDLKSATLEEGVADLVVSRRPPQAGEDMGKLERWWLGQKPEWVAAETRRKASEKAEPDGRTKVLVASESFPPVKYHTAGGTVETYKQTFVLKRGNVALKEEPADPGFLQVLTRAPEQRWAWTPPAEATYFGKRRALASWILDAEQGAGALAARVFVNRLWLHHFGRGIVATPNDFGRTGAPPSHPELLDWLAGQLLEKGGSPKAMHRLLMTSDAYQQAALRDAAKEKADPANDLFLRRTPRRLEAEAIRDSMLAVSGRLSEERYGPGLADENAPRRSVYLKVKRSRLIGAMASFDQPEPLASQGVRPTTTVAPQALLFMNSSLAQKCARQFAARLSSRLGKTAPPERFIDEAYAMALGRAPLPHERTAAGGFLDAQIAQRVAEGKTSAESVSEARADFCHVLFATNEFVYAP